MSHESRSVWRAALWAASLAILAGCGGHGAAVGSLGDGKGKAILTVKWPSRTRQIPVASNCLVVTLSKDGQQVGDPQKIARPTGDHPTTTATFSGLPHGDLSVDVKAYPNSDGSGVAQAAGGGTLTVSGDLPGAVTVALGSTVDTLSIDDIPTAFANSDVVTVKVSAKDKDGNVVLLSSGDASEPVTWSVDDQSVATVTGTGYQAKVTGGNIGATKLHASLKVTDDGARKEATPALLNVVKRTLTLSGPDTWIFGFHTFGYLLTAKVNPPFPNSVTVNLSATGPVQVLGPLTFSANQASSSTKAFRFQQVEQDTPVTFTATCDSIDPVSKTITLQPNPLSSIYGPATLASGAKGTAAVQLAYSAEGDEEVDVSCDAASVVIGKQVVKAGTNTTNFGFVAPIVDSETVITLTAVRLGVTKKWSVKITPN